MVGIVVKNSVLSIVVFFSSLFLKGMVNSFVCLFWFEYLLVKV